MWGSLRSPLKTTSFTSGWRKEARAGCCAAARRMFWIAKTQDAYELLCARVYPNSSEVVCLFIDSLRIQSCGGCGKKLLNVGTGRLPLIVGSAGVILLQLVRVLVQVLDSLCGLGSVICHYYCKFYTVTQFYLQGNQTMMTFSTQIIFPP